MTGSDLTGTVEATSTALPGEGTRPHRIGRALVRLRARPTTSTAAPLVQDTPSTVAELRSALERERARNAAAEADLRLAIEREREEHARQLHDLRHAFQDELSRAHDEFAAHMRAHLAGVDDRLRAIEHAVLDSTRQQLMPPIAASLLSSRGSAPRASTTPLMSEMTRTGDAAFAQAAAAVDVDGALGRVRRALVSSAPNAAPSIAGPHPANALSTAIAAIQATATPQPHANEADPPPRATAPPASPHTDTRHQQTVPRPHESSSASARRQRSVRANAGWFPAALRAVAAEDPSTAGRLLLSLMPLVGLAWPRDAAFDLDIAETGCISVDLRRRVAGVSARLEPRPPDSTDFVLRTDLAGLARTALARRAWQTPAAGRGDARRLLSSLANIPLSLRDLLRMDGAVDPRLLFRLLAQAVDPSWTTGHAFTVAFRTRDRSRQLGYVRVTDGAAVKVTDTPPLDRVRATLTCEPRELVEALLGDLELGGARARVSGDAAALAHVLAWFARVDEPSLVARVAAARGAAT